MPRDSAIREAIAELEQLEQRVSDTHKQDDLRRLQEMLERVPGTKQIHKYTSRDVGEAFVGALVFSLPLLVEDGVFDIAAWFVSIWLGPVPILLLANAFLVVVITAKLLYAVDFREVVIHHPLFGIIPRRLVGILLVSFLTACGMTLLWGRLHEGEPATLEALARVTVIWTAAALGAVLADVLPGESKGQDISELIGE